MSQLTTIAIACVLALVVGCLPGGGPSDSSDAGLHALAECVEPCDEGWVCVSTDVGPQCRQRCGDHSDCSQGMCVHEYEPGTDRLIGRCVGG